MKTKSFLNNIFNNREIDPNSKENILFKDDLFKIEIIVIQVIKNLL